MWRGTQGYPHDLSISTCEEVHLKHEMKAFIFTCLLAIAAAKPQPYGSDGGPTQSHDSGQYNAGGNNLAISQHEYNPAPYNPSPSQSTYNSAPYKPTPYKPNPSYKIYKPQPPAPLNANDTVAHIEEYRAIATAHQKVFEAAARLAAAHPESPSSAEYDPSQNGQYNPAWNNLAISQHEYKPGPSQSTYNPAPYKSTECNPHPSHKNYKLQPPAPLNADGTVAHTEEFRAIAAAQQKVFETAASLSAAHPYQKTPSSADYDQSQNGQYNPAWNNLAISQHEYKPGPSQSTYNPAPYESTECNPHPSHKNYKPQPPAPLNANGTVDHTEEYRAIAAALQKVFEAAASLAAAHPDQTSPSSTDYNTSQNGEYNAQVYDNGQNDLAWNNLAISQQEYNPAASKPEYNLGPSHSTFNSAAYESSPYNPNPSHKNYKPQPPAPLNANGTVAHTEEYRAIAAAHQKVFEAAASLAAAHPDQTSPSSTDYNTSQNGEYNAQVYDNGQNDLTWNNLAISQQEYNPATSKPEYNLGPSHSTFNSAAYESSPYNPNPSHKNYKPQPPAPLNANGAVDHTEEYRAIATAHQKVFEAAASLAAAHPDQTSPSSTDYNTSQNGEYNAQVYDNGQNDLAWNNLAISQQEYNPAASKPEYNLGPSHSSFNSAAYESSPYNPNPSHKNYKPQPPAPLNANDTVAHIEEYRAIAAAYQKVFEAAASLAAAHPDRTYPPSADYDPSQNGHVTQNQTIPKSV